MYIVAVTIFVEPDKVDAFKEAILDNAKNTRLEVDNFRFDVSQGEDDPTRFLLYEVYRDREGFEKHQKTEHYLRWKNAVTDWMAQPRQGLKYQPLFYGDSSTR
jgi:(4S)-4-hydroxy-5-phosphonooxypentane-2,3-dione isomerase